MLRQDMRRNSPHLAQITVLAMLANKRTRGCVDHFNAKSSTNSENICYYYLFTASYPGVLVNRQCLALYM